MGRWIPDINHRPNSAGKPVSKHFLRVNEGSSLNSMKTSATLTNDFPWGQPTSQNNPTQLSLD